MLKRAIPVLHVANAAVAEAYYCDGLGFRRRFAYRPDVPALDPCYMGLERDGVVFHVSSFRGDGVAGGIATFIVDDLDALHAELIGRRVPIELEPTNQDWENREMYLRDPDGNSIRFIQGKSD